MTDDSESIFSARKKDPWNNACLNFMFGGNTWTGYSMGYKNGADILSQYVDSTQRHQDTLVYPILFLYRHYLEIILKKILIDCAKVLDEKISFKHHNISTYWKTAKDKCQKLLEEKIPDDMVTSVENIIRQLADIDKASDAFRYPCHIDGSPSLHGITHINIKQVSEEISKASEALEAISAAMHVVVEMKADHAANMRQLYGCSNDD